MQNERTPDDFKDAAAESLELARVLAGQSVMSDQTFLETMVRSDRLADHDGEKCGMCYKILTGAQIAREMIEEGVYEDVVSKWCKKTSAAGESRSSSSSGRKRKKRDAIRIRRSRSGDGSREME